jgi:hypothetical protein
MAPIQNLSASSEECWQVYFDLISWTSEGGKNSSRRGATRAADCSFGS